MREGQQNYSADEKKRLPGELREVVAENGLENRGVGGEPARQFPRSPLGEEARREMNEVGEEILSQPRDDQLRRRGEQIHLHEIEYSLYREQDEEPYRNCVEQRRVGRDECRIEQVSYDLWKGERDRGARQQTHERAEQAAGIRSYAREQAGQRTRRRNRRLLARRWYLSRNRKGRRSDWHQPPTLRSTTIATKRSAR
jgi:hypothetical protein